jgi:hypothetical protein
MLTTNGNRSDTNASRFITDAKPNRNWFVCGVGQELPG